MIGPLPADDPSAFPEGKGVLAIWRWLRFISTQNEFFLWMFRMIIVWIALVVFLCTMITLRCAAWAKRLRRPYTVGFLHPNCHKKGGGERVLWLAVQSLLEKNSELQVVVYCSPAAAANVVAMYDSLESDLGICLRPALSPRIKLVPVRFTSYIDFNFPFCTILFQSLAGIPLSVHCMFSYLPSLFIDTRGCPLSSIAPFFLGCTTVSYVHYPTISDDMVKSVSSGAIAPNNRRGGRNPLKLAYYHLVCRPMYFFGGQFVNLAMANSKWTRSHIEKRWGGKAALVHPPVDVETFAPAESASFVTQADDSETDMQQQQQQQPARDIAIISCAQFRPEKEHSLQIDIMRRVCQKLRDEGKSERELPRLMIVGGISCDDDRALLDSLRKTAHDMSGIVSFHENMPFQQLIAAEQRAVVFLHTMRNEHFGISLVEAMAAGAIVIAHNSGGPRDDICLPPVAAAKFYKGCSESIKPYWLCDDVEDFADAIISVLGLPADEQLAVSREAQRRARAFGNRRFCDAFWNVLVFAGIFQEKKKAKAS